MQWKYFIGKILRDGIKILDSLEKQIKKEISNDIFGIGFKAGLWDSNAKHKKKIKWV